MSIPFKCASLGRARFAILEDAPFVKELVNENIAVNFRINTITDIEYLIENGVLSICQLDVNGKLVGFLCARDYPLIPSVHPSAWEEYVWTKYKAIELNARNTLFLHLICWDTVYSRDIVDHMLKTVFMHDTYLHFIAMVKSLPSQRTLVPGQSRAETSFRKLTACERGIPGDQLPTLSIVDRKEVCPGLKIRRAVEEDNDDIVPIIEKHSERLRELYGDFYISELISRHPESERALLVCESRDIAVGVMCLNTQINFEALEENFELSPFAGLRRMKVSPFHGQNKEMEPSMSVTVSANDYGHTELMTARRTGGITWLYDDNDFKPLGDQMDTEFAGTWPTPIAQLDILDILESDEEDFEFDIVNIDTELLRVPKFLAYEDDLGPIIQVLDPAKRQVVEEKTKGKEKPKPGAPNKVSSAVREREPFRYKGPPNAFILELFAIHDDFDERFGFDMLEAAFELYKDRDYCILCLPSNHASFPLLDHFTLVTPYSVRTKYINETLYVVHVNSLRSHLKVRVGEAYDIAALYDILEHEPCFSTLLELYEDSLSSLFLQSYVMLSQQQPVGLAILGPLEEGLKIRTQYDLDPEPRRVGTDGFILYGILSPVLEPHARWFLRELLRLSSYSTLFWLTKLFGKSDAMPGRQLMSFAGHMAPVHPRSPMPTITGNTNSNKTNINIATPFALWFIEKPITSLPKVNVNNGIVVIGASRTGLSFIETLLTGPTSQYLTFTNITLVSEHGLPTGSECLEAALTCVPKDGRYTDRYLKTVPFHYYIDVMSAILVAIDRKKKCIRLKGGGVKYYDELVLTCGQQFQHPDSYGEPFETVNEPEHGKLCDRMLMDNYLYRPDQIPVPPDMPDNVNVINSLYDANICLRKLMRMVSDAKDTGYCLSTENRILVYGECIEAYSCMAALLELGLSPTMICFIEPFPPEDSNALRVNCFNNETVDERVQTSIENMGIKIYRRYTLASWMQRGNHVESLHLISRLQAVIVPCFSLFYYGWKAINTHVFKAINECGLVYDGGLVVGPSFETNDPHVYGAGKCVIYSRRLYAENRAHKSFCAEDVGEALGNMFLNKFDPFLMGDSSTDYTDLLPKCSSTMFGSRRNRSAIWSSTIAVSAILPALRWQPVLNFTSPVGMSATLPGPFYYMKLRKPGMEIPMEVQLSLPFQGHTLLTDKDGRYFRLQLNNLHCVNAVTCLSNKRFSPEYMSQLYGKHEAFFDKLLTRYTKGLITDMFDYFVQPWMFAMYQETFNDLLTDIHEQDVAMIHDLLRARYPFQSDKSESHSRTPSRDSDRTSLKSTMDRYLLRTSNARHKSSINIEKQIMECGQSEEIRDEARRFWKNTGGGKIVMAHMAHYLIRNYLTNQHYAVPSLDHCPK